MTLRAIILDLRQRYGQTVLRFRGRVPDGVILAIIAGETGGDVLSLASDANLDESGLSSEPLYVAYQHGIDPFDASSAIWLRCHVTNADAQRLLTEYSSLLRRPGRDLWYCAILRYSIGRGALYHVLDCVQNYSASLVAAHGAMSVAKAVRTWALATDLSLPAHKRYWGHQTPKLIRKRLAGGKHSLWLDLAAEVSDLDGPAGTVCPETPPDGCVPFPDEIKSIAKALLRDGTTEDEKHANWLRLRGYIRRLRKLQRAPKAPLIFRALRWIEPGRRISGRREDRLA